MVERCVRDAEAAGSNPVISTKNKPDLIGWVCFFAVKKRVRTCEVGRTKILSQPLGAVDKIESAPYPVISTKNSKDFKFLEFLLKLVKISGQIKE